ncbi:MAG: UDP-N-acetyl-D-mannosamine dehydrogenase [Synechococcales bacterium]|nr:UDP-N-acetyl-D-mannosamine dehydrogenase [Cyanobacteria bacterium REEB444]MEB3126034.1 UDP-N-acetyl-D-mannosamine dehydrogenase [Synechococcales bacterium]
MLIVKSNPPQICILGLGYIGLPTAALLSHHGYYVNGVDINLEVITTINQGKIHIVEPDLELLVHQAIHNQRLTASTFPSPADIFIICVPTPFHENSGNIPQPNIDYVLSAAESIIPVLKPGNLVILESTSPVGTTEKIAELFRLSGRSTDQIHLAYCPERVLPGNILQELIHNDRVIGGLSPEATTLAKKFYQIFCQGQLLTTDARTAELCKLTENTYRDVNLAFANQLSMLCPNLGIDVRELIYLANHHPRVNILQPGCGVGGHCIAVDPWFIAAADPHNTSLIQTAREVNNSKPQWVVTQIITLVEEFQQKYQRSPTIGCFGLAFKPNVDDLRGSPALEITTTLIHAGHKVLVVEPNLKFHERLELTSWQSAIVNADILVFLVAHKEFLNLDINDKKYLDFCGVTSRKNNVFTN